MNPRHLSAGLIMLVSLVATLTASESLPLQVSVESAKTNAFFNRVFDASVARSPMFMAELGIKKDMDKWDDISEARALEDFVINAQNLEELKRTINFAALDDQTQISYRMFVTNSERTIEGWKWRYHNYPLNQLSALPSDAPAFLINFHPIDNVADARAYLARLRCSDASGIQSVKQRVSTRALP